MLTTKINPPQPDPTKENAYKFNNDVSDALKALQYVMNPSVVSNANFGALGSHGQTPITTDTDISSAWNVSGASNASFIITSASYPAASLIQSASQYYLHMTVSSHNGGDFYFYQKQDLTIRKYQKNFLTYGLLIKNNQSKSVKIRMDIFTYYDPTTSIVSGKTINLQPGANSIASQVNTTSLDGKTVGAAPYTQFRLSFIDLGNGTADLEFYQIKCEFGISSTLLNQS